MKKIVWLLLVSWLFLLSGETAEAIAMHGEWKYYEQENYEDMGLDLIEQHSALRYDDPSWKTFSFPSRPSLKANTRYVWLTTKLPTVVNYHHPVLFFTTTEQAIRVYIDNELIYSDGEFGLYHHTYGTKWHMVELPANYKGRQLSFQLYSDHAGRLGVVNLLSLDEGSKQATQLFQHDIMSWLSLPLTLLLLIIVVLYYRGMHLNRHQRRIYVYLAFFLSVFALWLIATMRLLQLLPISLAFWRYIMLGCGYVMPLLGNLLVSELVSWKWCRAVRFIALVYGLIFGAVTIGELFGYTSMDMGLTAFYGWLAISQPLVFLMLLQSAWKGSSSSRAFLVPAFWVPALGIVDGLTAHFRLYESLFYFMPLASLFLAYFVAWLLWQSMKEEKELREINNDLKQKMKLVREEAQIDALTKCFNRGHLAEELQKSITIAEYSQQPLAVMMFDLDHFKRINDTYGHDMGDQVLIRFAAVVRRNLDARHSFVRYGGEEFVVLCRGFTIEGARQLAEHIREDVGAAVLCEKQTVTCSIGVTGWQGESQDTPAAVLKRVDNALYQAKNSGRNCVSVL
jgi:diguanylate cyclase (GGDEF)-like protein